MSRGFDSIKEGLQEAVEYAEGNKKGVRVHSFHKPDVKNVRNKIGMNQNEFALLCISPNTLRYIPTKSEKIKASAQRA